MGTRSQTLGSGFFVATSNSSCRGLKHTMIVFSVVATPNIFLCSSRNPGEDDPIWRAYLSNGLVQPPTRCAIQTSSPISDWSMVWWNRFFLKSEHSPKKDAGLEFPERSCFIRTVISSVPTQKFFEHRINLQNQTIPSHKSFFWGVSVYFVSWGTILRFFVVTSSTILVPTSKQSDFKRSWWSRSMWSRWVLLSQQKGLTPSKYPTK